ncbi:bifunctional RNase H/acid phosphatase [Streptosporangium saharense]|uniref:Putative phosphoglycerate mutase n=1 Tax=Streptosporangium saharense TaxID=1706840 RepID=A0A7W7QMM5_9ACTN|nr:bifunctional RNase H/acid phosphatase [Streptosporangium saharense]MBB4916405.1 putative phosphoglycerate mutase [Streptosporangium saharense]
MTSFVVEADGGSRGNPGPAGYGAVVKDAADGQILVEVAESIGTQTNNVAEYRGLIAGLRALLDLAGDDASVEVRMDSKLVIEQMAGRWKIKNEGLRPLATEAASLARRLRVTWRWIPRERNKDADRLANEAMDAAAKGVPWQSSFTAAPSEQGSLFDPPSESAVPVSGAGTTSASGATGAGAVPAPGTKAAPVPGADTVSEAEAARVTGAGAVPVSAPETKAAPVPGAGAVPEAKAVPAPGAGAVSEVETAPAPGAKAVLDVSFSEVGAGGVSDAETFPTASATTGTGWRPPTTTATSLLLLRHGETPMSVERRFSGLGDPELTPNGLAQARAAAARLTREPYGVQVVVSSPLRRALVTAETVAAGLGLDVVVEPELREADFGAWEGHTFTEIQRRWPDELATWLADPSAAPPGGESFGDAARRVQVIGDRLVERYEGRTVLVVSHVTPIKMLLRSALLAPLAALYRMHLDLASLSLIEYYADGPAVVKAFNDTSHLR